MNFISKAISIIFITIICSNANAVGDSPYEPTNFCYEVVQSGKEIALENASNGFNSNTTLGNFVNCNLSILPTSLSTEIMYSLFGRSVLPPLGHVNGFIDTIYTGNSGEVVPRIDEIELNNYLRNKIKTFPVLIATVEGLTFASFQLISGLIGIFSLLYLTSTMSEGAFLGKQINTFWTFAKMSSILAIIFPLNGMGLSIIQLFIIFIAFCGSFLASLIWSILPLFKYVYLTEFTSVDEDLKTEKDIITIQLAEDLVSANICDISSRQSLLLKGKSTSDLTGDILSSDKYFECLTTTPDSFFASDTIAANKNTSSIQQKRTAYCAEIPDIDTEVDCGFVKTTMDHSANFNSYLSEVAMVDARKIAVKMIASNCNDQENLKKGNEQLFYTYCSNVDNIHFEENYKKLNIISPYEGSDYSKTNYFNDLQSLRSGIENSLNANLVDSIIVDDEMTKLLSEKISYSLNKGWFNAGTFLFDIGNTTNIKNDTYSDIMLTPIFDFPKSNSQALSELNDSVKAGNTSGFGSTGTVNSSRLTGYESLPIKGTVKPISSQTELTSIYEINDDLKKIGLSDVIMEDRTSTVSFINGLDTIENSLSSINSFLFPTLVIGREFNEPDIGAEDSCSKDYSNCKKMPVNPIASIVDTSRQAGANSGIIIVFTGSISAAIEHFSNKAEKLEKRKVSSKMNESKGMMYSRVAKMGLDFVSAFLSVNMLISLLGGYVLPIVLFLYFVGNAVSWIVSLIYAVIGAPLWMGLHLFPSKEAGFAGHAKKGYTMLLDVFLKPVFLVLGVFGAFILSTIMVVILNATFEIVMSTFTFFDSPNNITELFHNFILNLIYVIFLLLIFFKSAKAVYKIPNSLENWVGLMAYEDASMWKEVTGLIERTFLSGIKKFLIFS